MWGIGARNSPIDTMNHYTGTWHQVTASALRGLLFFDIIALARNNVWAAAQGSGRNLVSYLVHFNGSRWVRFRSPWTIGFFAMAPDGHGGIWLAANNTSPGFWAVHRTASGLWHRFLITKSPEAGMAKLALIPGTSSLWAVGSLPHGPGSDATIWALGKVR